MFERVRDAIAGAIAGASGRLRADSGMEGNGYYGSDAGRMAYRGASLDSQETANWLPAYTSGDTATLWDRLLSGTRVRDLLRNDPHAVAAVVRLLDMLVGAGLRLAPRPDAGVLGIDLETDAGRKTYRDLVHAIKTEWRAWGEDPRHFNDAQRKLSFHGQMRMIARTYLTLNGSTSYLTWREIPGARYATGLRVFDPDRLSNPFNEPNTLWMRGGIEFTDDGEPIAYHVRNGHPADAFRMGLNYNWTRIPARTDSGRPVFIHAFEPEREDQSREISPFAPLMTRLRMLSKFGDTELASATVNALFAAFVSSNLPLADATAALTPNAVTYADRRLRHYQNNPARLMGVRIPVMPIGDEIKINSSPRQTAAFQHFTTVFLQSIAAPLGLSYEQLAMDWTKTNYSSARAALNEVWRRIRTLSQVLIEQAVNPVYYAVIEEAFDRGYITAPPGAPDFWEAPGAYLQAKWIGPPRGYVDPTKEAEAATLRMASLTSTLEMEAAEQGNDFEDLINQIAVEDEMLAARGLSRLVAAPGKIEPQPAPGEELASTDEDAQVKA